MRQILTISLPTHVAKQAKQLTKQRGFDSMSSYIKNLVEEDQDMMSAEELLTVVKQARKNYKGGKSVKADSLLDLL